jgi:hypothetical protein
MKRAFLFGIILYGLVNVGISQNIAKHSSKEIKSESIEIVGSNHTRTICGNILFKEDMKKINDYISSHPEYQKSNTRLQKPQAYVLGDPKDWWVINTVTDSQSVLSSTCLAVGKNCYIFVSDDSWTNEEVTQDQINELVDAFDNSTPNFPNEGIYDVDVKTYGEPPDFDGDSKIIIFLYDIQDDFATTRTATLGYFFSVDQYNDGDPAIGSRRSNEAEIFYVDTYPQLDEDIFGIDQAKITLAHEFQHMIHYAHDVGEMTFINEGLSLVAEHVCGYGLRSNSRYTQNTNRNLLSWDHDDTLPDYSRAAFWTLYIYEQYPIGILKDFVNNHHSTWLDIKSTLSNYTPVRGFFTFFEDWLIANYVNGNSADAKYMYQYSPLSKPAPFATYIGNPNGEQVDVALVAFGAHYIKFNGGSDLTITFTGDKGIKIYALKIGSLEVEEVTRDVPYSPIDFGTTYPEVTFLVYNQIQSKKKYSYVATGTAVAGTMELAYEDGEPEGYYIWSVGDSVAVQFNGISDAKLDSLRIAFRRTGDIQMDISELDGTAFLRGRNLYGPVQVNSPDSISTISPYPIPYDNWVTVDLSTENIDASKNFIISFLIGNKPAEPGVMMSFEATTGGSLTYTDNEWGPVPSSDGLANYLIRAYVTIGGTTVLAQPTITSIVANQGYIKLSWNFSAGPVEGYNIYRSTTTGFAPDTNNMIGIVGNTVTNYTDAWPNIQANTDYFYRISSFDGDGNESDFSEEVTIKTLDVNEIHGIPTEYSLESNYPNPFNPSTTFRFSTPKDGLVNFTVHDLLGRVVYSENKNLFAGNYSFTWNGQNELNQQVVSGVYFLRMEAEEFSQTRKMLMMK